MQVRPLLFGVRLAIAQWAMQAHKEDVSVSSVAGEDGHVPYNSFGCGTLLPAGLGLLYDE
jgi:hypothetical protein